MACVRGIALLLVVCSLCFAANIKDPLSRSGVWEASAIVDQRPIELLLSLQIETSGKTGDGTFAVNEVSGRISSAQFALAPSGIGCFFLKVDVELDDSGVRGVCINISDKAKITLSGFFDSDDQGLVAVLTLSNVDTQVHFRRIPLDENASLDGEWAGTFDFSRNSRLHARTFGGAPVVTMDRWTSQGGFWGWFLEFSLVQQRITFSRSGTCCAWFYGQLTPDKQHITGGYEGGQFGSSSYTRVQEK